MIWDAYQKPEDAAANRAAVEKIFVNKAAAESAAKRAAGVSEREKATIIPPTVNIPGVPTPTVPMPPIILTVTDLPQWLQDWLKLNPAWTAKALAAASAGGVPGKFSIDFIYRAGGGETGLSDWRKTPEGTYYSNWYSSIYSTYLATMAALPNIPANYAARQAAIKKLEQDLKDYAESLTRTQHPGLWELAQRFLNGAKLTAADYGLAEWYISMYPELPLAGKPEGYTNISGLGFTGLRPINEYSISQIYVAAKNALVAAEAAKRRLQELTAPEIAQAKSDVAAYATSVPTYPVGGAAHAGGGMPSGFPIEFYNLACAHSYGGNMTDEQYKNAAAYLILKFQNKAQGTSNPLPGESGYKPLPPLSQEWEGSLTGNVGVGSVQPTSLQTAEKNIGNYGFLVSETVTPPVTQCPEGQYWDDVQNMCVSGMPPTTCGEGYYWSVAQNACVLIPPVVQGDWGWLAIVGAAIAAMLLI